jgi:carboxypeptidase family protein
LPCVASLVLLAARPAAADVTCRLSGMVADINGGKPVEGARVKVSDRHGVIQITTSNAAGRYSIDVPPGDYAVAFEYGTSRTVNQISVTQTCTSTLDDGKVDTTGEVIVIQDLKPPTHPATATNYKSRANPPYSDEAIARDAWTRAWMLLDVSSTGEVTQFKFLQRPGYDLETIAAREVFKLQFEPARDEHGQPMRIWMVWGMEWPSNGWLVAMNLPRSTRPPIVGWPPHRMSDTVPCKGSGPMHLGSIYPTYRDCSQPDLSKYPSEPWIARP